MEPLVNLTLTIMPCADIGRNHVSAEARAGYVVGAGARRRRVSRTDRPLLDCCGRSTRFLVWRPSLIKPDVDYRTLELDYFVYSEESHGGTDNRIPERAQFW